MRLTVKRIAESLIILAISAFLWQIMLIPVADTINAKAPLSLPQNIIAFVGFLIPVILINLYAVKQSYLNWKELKLDGALLKCFIFGMIAALAVHFIAIGIGYIEGEYYFSGSGDSGVRYLVIDLMTAWVLSPLAEELVFRRILTTVIFPSNLKISLVITGIIFAVIHLPVTVGDWVNQLGAAAILSIIYYKTKRVEICILVHILMNIFVTAVAWMVK